MKGALDNTDVSPYHPSEICRRRRTTPFTPEDKTMEQPQTNMMTAGNIAKQLGISDAKVKKAIAQLGIKPKAKKGVCSYYGADVVAKVKSAMNS